MKVMGQGSPSVKPVVDFLALSKDLYDGSRTNRSDTDAMINGHVGKSTKMRKNRVILVADKGPNRVERRYTLQMAFQMSLGEKARRVMEAVERNGGGKENFEIRVAGWLRDAESRSTNVTRTRDANGALEVRPVIGEDHLLGKTPDLEENKKWLAGLIEGLRKEGIDCQDWCRFSVVTKLGCLFNSACLRERSALGLVANTSYFKQYQKYEEGGGNRRKQEWRFVIRLPAKEKATRKQNRKLNMVQKEHEIHGPDVVRWCMVMNVVGREFLRQDNGSVDDDFGPLGPDGKKLSTTVFGTIFQECMLAYFGVANADVYALRSSQDSLAIEDLLAAGETTDHSALGDLCREQRTRKDVSEVFGSLIPI